LPRITFPSLNNCLALVIANQFPKLVETLNHTEFQYLNFYLNAYMQWTSTSLSTRLRRIALRYLLTQWRFRTIGRTYHPNH